MRKSWNFSPYQTASLERLLQRLLAAFERNSAALILPADAKALYVRAKRPADIATLPAAALQCLQYVPLKDGDIAICNDPFAGGTRLADVSLVTSLTIDAPDESFDLLLAVRIPFPPRMTLSGTLEAEGVRIPPMPLGNSGRLNREILNVISQAPLAPADFTKTIEATVTRMETIRRALKASGRDPNSDLRKSVCRRYLQDCKAACKTVTSRLTLGETTVTTNLEGGELLKLRLEIIDDKVIFDFSGTETSSTMQMTELTTFGACYQALCAVVGHELPANAGTFQLLEVHTPARAWINAKSPAATTRGAGDGMALVSSTVLKAFARMNEAYRVGASAVSACRVQFVFADGRLFSDTTPGGTGATRECPGLDGWNLWLDRDTEALPTESAETSFPLMVKSVTPRAGSAGRGRWAGGQGISKSYCLMAPARMTWALEQVNEKAEGAEGGKPGVGCEILVQHEGGHGEKIKLATQGELDLRPGDIVRVHSGGGGGFGEPSTEENKSV